MQHVLHVSACAFEYFRQAISKHNSSTRAWWKCDVCVIKSWWRRWWRRHGSTWHLSRARGHVLPRENTIMLERDLLQSSLIMIYTLLVVATHVFKGIGIVRVGFKHCVARPQTRPTIGNTDKRAQSVCALNLIEPIWGVWSQLTVFYCARFPLNGRMRAFYRSTYGQTV